MTNLILFLSPLSLLLLSSIRFLCERYLKQNEIVKEIITSNNGAKRQKKAKSNYHIGKTILFGLLAIGVGLYFGWFYALIPIAVLIFFIFLDKIFDFCPGPKKNIIVCYAVFKLSQRNRRKRKQSRTK